MQKDITKTLPAVPGMREEAGTIVAPRELANALYAQRQAPAAHVSLYFLPVKSPELSLVAYLLADHWQDWVKAYGQDFCMECLRQAYLWSRNNAGRAKTARGIHRFFNGWLAREAKKNRASQPRTGWQKQRRDMEDAAAMALMAGEYLAHGNTGSDSASLGHVGDNLPAPLK
ncbi:hypothetical protein LJC46_02255 [Desulfovibrio sp. OttesenSCG-928-G15]|nr:hypothetical protein [Desulfovibrio sp. OttesenSCG-928-G15]